MNSFTKGEITEIAKLQKIICYLCLGVLIGLFAPILGGEKSVLGFTVSALGLLTGVWAIFYVYFLAGALRVKKPWLYALGMFIPVVKLFVLLRVIRGSTTILRAHGIRVGLMGVKKSDLGNLINTAG